VDQWKWIEWVHRAAYSATHANWHVPHRHVYQPFGDSSAIGSGSSVNSLRDVTVNMPSAGLAFSGLFIDGHGVNVDASALILQIMVGDPTCGQPILTFRRQ
jgi:hypothetical protein